MGENDETIQVALRIRPLVPSELEKGCQSTLERVYNEPQVYVRNTDKSFTYNYVFGPEDTQSYVYNVAVRNLIDKLFKGFNVTILAYGQTGSGKTYSMGTAYDGGENGGIIPRSVIDIFNRAKEFEADFTYKITACFIELYQEQLYDLLAPTRCLIDIREDGKGIKIPGLTEIPVDSPEDLIDCLVQGSTGRATGATAMNAQSSRSHAIFTINIEQTKKSDINDSVCAKFHLVDLAGSERPKKTKTEGERFREGVNINRGLLALGNVISALGEGNQSHIPYRDSKLTRLLQDSLGGNSVTLMIACVSPADYNMLETLSTLRYADRAKQIKNKPVVNRDPKAAEIMRLKEQVRELQVQLLGNGNCGDMKLGVDFDQHRKLIEENSLLTSKLRKLTEQMNEILNNNVDLEEKLQMAEQSRARLQLKLVELQDEYDLTINNINQTLEENKDICPAQFVLELQKLCAIQRRIQEVQEEHKRGGEELVKHEISTLSIRSDSPICGGNEKVDDEQQELHAIQQAKLSKELQDLSKQLAFKEELVSKLVESSNEYVKVKKEYEQNQRIVESLKKERDSLQQMITSLQANTDSTKTELHRKRIQELELKMSELNKKLLSQAKVIRTQHNSEEKITRLQSEIQGMKQAKVKLLRQMKSESEKFRQWRLERERELCKLKDQDRKRLNQIVKMERQHEKVQNVLRRKVEEVAAVNKRLKDALALQKSIQDRKNNKGDQSQRMQHLVERELEVIASTALAEKTLEDLMEDRALLNSKLASLREISNPTLETQDEIERLANEIDFRSGQIADMQQKIVDFDQENKSKRWDCIQSMVDAKCALKALFDLAAELKRESCRTADLEEAKRNLEALLEEKENEIKDTITRHKKTLDAIEQEHQNKVLVLLKQLSGSQQGHSDTATKDRIEIMEAELEKFEELKSAFSRLEIEHRLLKEEKNNKLRKRNTRNRNNSENITSSIIEEEELNEDTIIEDDTSKDPDWWMVKGGIKRGSGGQPRCSCKGDCSKKMCSCRKTDMTCKRECRCAVSRCINRSSELSSSNSNRSSDEHVEELPEKKFRKVLSSVENTISNQPPKEDGVIVMKTPRRTFFRFEGNPLESIPFEKNAFEAM